jgi:hypothetical protein
MKLIACFLLSTSFALAQAPKPVAVKSTTTKTGEYKPAYTRTAPNATKADNYFTKGNTNPYTGKAGTKNPKQ